MSSENITTTFTRNNRYTGIGRPNDSTSTYYTGRYTDRNSPTETGDVTDAGEQTNTTGTGDVTGANPNTSGPVLQDGKLNGVDNETKAKMKDMLGLIENQITKYKGLSEKETSPELKQKLTFWQHTKAMEVKIQNRLKKFGVDAKQEEQFKKIYDNRSEMLLRKFQQKVNADNKPHFYGNLDRINSKLTQLATGSTKAQMSANKELTLVFSDKIEEQLGKINEISAKIKELQKELKQAKTTEAKEKVKKKLEKQHAKRQTEHARHRAYYTASMRFGGRSKNFSDIDRVQYEEFIEMVDESEDGDISVNFLP